MSSGKGDKPRPVDKKKFDQNYKKIFGEKLPFSYQSNKKRKNCLKKTNKKKFRKIY